MLWALAAEAQVMIPDHFLIAVAVYASYLAAMVAIILRTGH